MSENRYRALLIENRHSRLGGDAVLETGLECLRGDGISLIQIKSESVEETTEALERHHSEIDFVILAGGDGTISSAAASLYRHRLTFAILPLGTANDLARTLGVPEDLEQACQIISDNHRRRVDLGAVNGHYFFNAANIGLGVSVTHELSESEKKKWGVFSYLTSLVNAFRKTPCFDARIDIDGRQLELRSIQIAVGNGRYYGGGTVIDESSSIEEGLLHFYSLQPQNFRELLAMGALLREGRQGDAERAVATCGRRISITTVPSLEINADGELTGHTPAVFEVLPRALEVILPPVADRADAGAGARSSAFTSPESEAANL